MGLDGLVVHEVVQAPKARTGDKVAVLSPSFAAPGFAPAVHEQAMRRLAEVTGLVPVEYPTTRMLGALEMTWLVSSVDLARLHGTPTSKGGLRFSASTKEGTQDQWSPYRAQPGRVAAEDRGAAGGAGGR